MCGIAGQASLGTRTVGDRAELAAMIHAVHHRGPDGYGFYQGDGVALAHARLSIIDLSTGDQPIHNEDRSIWVVFNGEIFNYLELREALLAAGHRFYTSSDTEVIVHAYEEYGDDFVDHLNGQFAIALWDSKRQRLVLTRDRTGIRPLFYTQCDGRLLFASEVKSLLAVPAVPRRLDPHALAETFTYWSPVTGRSAFEGIQVLPPGHLAVLERGQFSCRCYWDWTFPAGHVSTARTVDQCADELRELLIDSVRLQLRADVPVGAYLSGGLDSSIITSIIRNFTSTPLRTFSITFEDAEFDESAHQRELIDYLGTTHTEVRCTRADIGAAFPRAIRHTEVPIVRTAPTPMMLLSAQVRAEGYKVVLTGEGADEVFGGYDIFKEAKIRRFMARAPDSRWRARILSRLYPYLEHSPAAHEAFARQFFSEGAGRFAEPCFSHIPRWTTTQRVARFFSAPLRAQIGAWDPYATFGRLLPADIGTWEPMSRDQYVESHTLLSGYLLSSQGDRMGMANSIEGRFPFLDHRVVEFASRLPTRYKIMGLNEKYLLKRAMHDYLPEGVRSRTKQPYRAPDSSSFFVDGKPLAYVEELFGEQQLNRAGYFDASAARKLFEKCRAGRALGFADNMAFVGILSTMLLHAQFIESQRFD